METGERLKQGNQYIWTDSVAFEKSVHEYFEGNNTPTWSGLALHLGFASRQSLWEYGKRDGFALPVKKALSRIESYYESNLLSRNAPGAIFALKNLNWSDRQEIDHTTQGAKIETVPTINVYNQAPPIATSEDQI